MSKRITPNAEHRIVEGDIVTDGIDEKIKRGRAFSEEKAKEHHVDDVELAADEPLEETNDPESLLKDVDPNAKISEVPSKPSFMKRHLSSIMWLLLFSAVITVLFVTRPDSDWQIQKINELQQEVGSLKEQNQLLQEQFQEQAASNRELVESAVQDVLAVKSNQPAVSQQDIENIKQAFNDKVQQLEQQLSSLTAAASGDFKALNEAIEEAMSQKSDPGSADFSDKLNELEGSLQQQFNAISEHLADLFAFKEEQKILSTQPTKLELHAPLNSLQIQQWIVEINTQWLLNGRIADTRKQLLALEQAASLSDFRYTTQLARLIGQDLGYLQQLKQKELQNPTPDLTALRNKIKSLGADQILTSNIAAATDQTVPSSGFDQLMQSFSQLMTIKKRDEESDMLEVNKLLLNDVMKQRLALLVDRLQWGVSSESKELIDQAIVDIKVFVKQHYSQDSAEFSGLLQPFTDLTFIQHESLSVMRLDESLEN